MRKKDTARAAVDTATLSPTCGANPEWSGEEAEEQEHGRAVELSASIPLGYFSIQLDISGGQGGTMRPLNLRIGNIKRDVGSQLWHRPSRKLLVRLRRQNGNFLWLTWFPVAQRHVCSVRGIFN